jgi:hypothetical protein
VNGAFGLGTALLLRPFRIRGRVETAPSAQAAVRPGG